MHAMSAPLNGLPEGFQSLQTYSSTYWPHTRARAHIHTHTHTYTHTRTHRALQLQESWFKSCYAFQRPVVYNSEFGLTFNSLKSIILYIGRFIMFSVITNIYNKQTKAPTLMELFTATGKLIFFTTRDVQCVHHRWHGTLFKFLPHTRQYFDACVARTWISYRCVPCHPWCTLRTSLVVKKKTVLLWLWTIPLR